MKAVFKCLWALLVLAATIFLAEPVFAQSCSVSVRGDIAFGTYDPLLTGNLDTTGTIRIGCSKFQAIPMYTVKMGTGSGAGYLPRRMFKGAEGLNYNLYLDGAYSMIWGDGTSGTSFLTETAVASNKSYIVYARTPLGQDVSAGAYSDIVTVTVEW